MAMDLKQLVKEEESYNDKGDGGGGSLIGSGDASHVVHVDGDNKDDDVGVDPSRALQSFLDHISIASILSISPNPSSSSSSSSSVLELKFDDCVQDAISLLYAKNVWGAPIIDYVDSDLGNFVDRDIGFIEFSSMVLWSLEELENVRDESKCNGDAFMSMLEQHPLIGQTKIGELARAFVWEPFFPANSNDTLFHVLLLFAKHPRLNVIPVVESSNSHAVGFIKQNAVVQLLLESSGLDWFDQIADKSIAEFGFERASRSFCVYGTQSLSDVLHILWEEQADGVPIVDKGDETLIGVVRCSDVHLLLGENGIFSKRRTLTTEEFIKTCSDGSCKVHRSSGAFLLKNDFLPQMNTFVTNRRSDSLKQAMKSLVASNCSQSLLIDELGKLEGIVTLRDIISQFSPPSVDSRMDGGGFFEAALEQSGCHVEDGSLICNH